MPRTGALAMLKRRAIAPRRSRSGAGCRALHESESPAGGSSLRTRAPSIARSGIGKVNVDHAKPRLDKRDRPSWSTWHLGARRDRVERGPACRRHAGNAFPTTRSTRRPPGQSNPHQVFNRHQLRSRKLDRSRRKLQQRHPAEAYYRRFAAVRSSDFAYNAQAHPSRKETPDQEAFTDP